MRFGTVPGDPEHLQTFDNLKSRIAMTSTSDSLADQRLARTDELETYYRDIGVYDDITPDDGSSETFTPAQPISPFTCAQEGAIAISVDHLPLIHDCQALLAAKDALVGSGSLNWDVSTDLANWDSVTTGLTPTRVTELNLAGESSIGFIPTGIGNLRGLNTLDLGSKGLTGPLPDEMGNLFNLESLDLRNNDLNGSIPARFSPNPPKR